MLTRRNLLLFGQTVPPLWTLFRNGEDGFLFGDWSELDELFTTSTGTTAVAADNDPVGLALDDRAWGVRTLAQQLAQATELLVPGSWTMGTAPGSGTATESPSGQLNLTGDGTNQSRGDQSFATVVGRTYRVAGTVAGNTVLAFVGTSQGGSEVTSQTWAAGASYSFYFVATATTTWVRVLRSGVGTAVVTSLSCKAVSGNHALQATSTQRPVYKANSGKPYLSFDGSDDRLLTPCAPPSAGAVFAAIRVASAPASTIGIIAGGHTTSNRRCYLAVKASGKVEVNLGSTSQAGATTVTDNTPHVVGVVYSGAGATIFVDGAVDGKLSPAQLPDGSGSALALGCLSNQSGQASFLNGAIFAALAINRAPTPAEIALITRQLQRTYQ